MSDEERNSLEEAKFEVGELDDTVLEDVSGGAEDDSNTNVINNSQCSAAT